MARSVYSPEYKARIVLEVLERAENPGSDRGGIKRLQSKINGLLKILLNEQTNLRKTYYPSTL